MDKLLSIIVPVYNVEKYISKCIESIINQNYEHFELILIDDGSTDTSGKICDKYSMIDKRIKVTHTSNNGPGAARNIGLKLAKGNYITFLDSDDYVKNDYYDSLIKEMQIHDVDIIQGAYDICVEIEKKVIKKKQAYILLNDKKKICFEFFRKYYFDNYLWNKIFKSEIIKNCEFPNLFYSEDQCFLLSTFYNANKVMSCNINGYIHLIQSNSLCKTSFSNKKLDVFKAINIMKNYGLEKNLKGLEYLSIDICSYAVRYYPYTNKDQKSLLKKMFKKNFKIYKQEIAINRKNKNLCSGQDSNRKELLLKLFNFSAFLSNIIIKKLKL